LQFGLMLDADRQGPFIADIVTQRPQQREADK
jgi:hypothetical protein